MIHAYIGEIQFIFSTHGLWAGIDMLNGYCLGKITLDGHLNRKYGDEH